MQWAIPNPLHMLMLSALIETQGVRVYNVAGKLVPETALWGNGVYLIKIKDSDIIYKIMLVR